MRLERCNDARLHHAKAVKLSKQERRKESSRTNIYWVYAWCFCVILFNFCSFGEHAFITTCIFWPLFLWKAIWEQREYNYQSADSLIAEPETPASRRPSCARAWYPARESQRQARMPQGSPGSDSALPVLLVLLRNTLPPLVLRIPLHDTSPNRTRLILHFLFPLLISGSYYFCRLVPCPSECSASTSLLLECVLIPSSPSRQASPSCKYTVCSHH